MPTIKKLQRTWQREFDGKQDKPVEYPALMGRLSDEALYVTGRPGFIHVRIGNDEALAQARWSGPVRYNSKCVCGYVRKVFRVLRLDQDDYVTAGNEPIPDVEVHGNTHLWFNPDDTTTPNRASDPTFVSWRQIMELRVGKHTSGDFTVRIESGLVEESNEITWVVTQTVDLTSSIPASGARWVLVYLLPDGTIGTSDGDIVAKSALTVSDIPVPTFFHYRLAAVMLWLGQTQICDDGVRADIQDLRFPQGFNHDAVNYLTFDTSPTGVPDAEGVASWNTTDKTLNLNTGLGPVLQVGQETYLPVYNNTGEEIANGQVVAWAGEIVGGLISIVKANASTHESVAAGVGMVTMTIPDSSIGLVTRAGSVRGDATTPLDTSGTPVGTVVYVPTSALDLYAIARPAFPNYALQVGAVTISDAVNGEILVSVEGNVTDTIQNFWNGVFRESINFTITSDGATITGSLEPHNSHDDMTMMFSDGFTLLDTSPPVTIVLTAGTDDTPQTNYVYVPETTKVLTVSTSDWPMTEHIKVATVVLRTAATTELDGALRNQNWNDHIQSTTNNQGHLSHIGERIRQENARWDTGTEGSITIDSTPAPDDVWVKTTGGVVYQMHRQTFPILDMTQYTIDAVHQGNQTFTISGDGDLSSTFSDEREIKVNASTGNDGRYTVASTIWSDPDFVITVEEAIPNAVADGTIGDDIHVVNDSVNPFDTITNLNVATDDATGASLANKSFAFVVWGVQNKSGQTSHLMLNLPTGSYGRLQPDQAVEDASNYSVYSIPKQFQGVGFLIARFIFTLDAGGNVWTLYSTQDLRGFTPNTAAGGGAGGGGVSTFLALTDTPAAYTGQALEIPQVNAGETALEFTDTPVFAGLTMSGGNIDLDGNTIIFDGDGDAYMWSPIDDVIDMILPGAGGEFAININGAEVATFTDNAFNILAGSNIIMGEATSIGIGPAAERVEFYGAGFVAVMGANLGVGTTTPGQNIAGDITDLVGTVFHVKDSSNFATLVAEGDSGAALNLIDLGGAADEKWLNIFVDASKVRFRQLDDDQGGVIDILAMDLATGNVGIGTIAPGSLMEWNFADDDLEFVDAHAASAVGSISGVIEVQRGGATEYIALYDGYTP